MPFFDFRSIFQLLSMPLTPDLAPITRHARAVYSSRLLIAAVHHLNVFETLADTPLSPDELRRNLGLSERPAMVLFPALCAMDMLKYDTEGRLQLTAVGHHLSRAAMPTLMDYVGLEKNDPGVIEMAERLLHDGPLHASTAGIAYVKDHEAPSPMDNPDEARRLTLALAGRAQCLAPIAAELLPRHSGHLLDVAGGTGYFTYEWLLRNPEATATLLDRPSVLAVAAETLESFCKQHPEATSLSERVRFMPGDMLEDTLLSADIILAASVFHDWPADVCYTLARRFAEVLRPEGELWIHDAFLNDALDGPLPVTDYSAQLFWVTKGRAYSRKEYRHMMEAAGLAPLAVQFATQMDYGLIAGKKHSSKKD